jgi:hypothetical protein
VSDDSAPGKMSIQVPLVWGNLDKLPVLAANQFLVQVSAGPSPEYDEILLTAGHAAPPVLLGSQEQQETAARQVTNVQVTPIGRYSVSRANLAALASVVNQLLGSRPAGADPLDGEGG